MDRKRRRIKANHRLVKVHRSYTVEELAKTLDYHPHAIRRWIDDGLGTIDDKKPKLIHGLEAVRYIKSRNEGKRTRCGRGQLYCVKCHDAKRPAGEVVEYMPFSPTAGNLRGICPDCETLMHRRVARARIDEIRHGLEVTFAQAPHRIGDSASPTVIGDSSRADRDHEDV